MGLFSKKEDTRYIKEFDDALANLNDLAAKFRDSHFASLEMFDKNFKKEKSSSDFHKERELFEEHLEILQKMKFNSDVLIDEALKIVRNETALTEKDRVEIRKILEKKAPTNIQMKK